MASADENAKDSAKPPASGSGRTPTVFVTDASAESSRIADTLRTAGYAVVDVPLSLLVARAQVQRPNVVIVDVDATRALDEIARLRRLPGGGAIDFVYFGGGGGVIRNADDAMANEGSAFFSRPVDIGALVRRIESLTGGPVFRPEIRPSTPPPSIPRRQGSVPPLPPSAPSDRGSSPSLPAPGLRTPGPPLPMSTPSLADLVDPPRSLATFGTVSSELQQLLAEAEMRAEVMPHPDAPLPTPEEEIETVLPADVLASLDEPLEGDEDEEHEHGRHGGGGTGTGTGTDGTGAHAKGTTSGGSRQTTASGRPASSQPHSTHERRVQRSAAARPATGAGDSDHPESPAVVQQHTTARRTSSDHPVPSSRRGGAATPAARSLANDPTLKVAPLRVTPVPPARQGSPSSDSPPRSERRPPPPGPQKLDSVTIATVDLEGAAQQPPPSVGVAPPARSIADAGVVILNSLDARRFFADAISRHLTGSLCFEHDRVVRRIVVRDGDLVTAASGADHESLVSFLGTRGELPRDEVDRLAGKVPPYGRHAGAALVAHGWLKQDQLWNVLRAHAEWIATSVLRITGGTAQLETEPPGRLRTEPSVFAASTGAEIFVELVRRAVSPDDALEALGGDASRIGDGPMQTLLAECALPPADLELVSRSRGGTVADLLARSSDAEIASVVHGLALLGILDVMPVTSGGAAAVAAESRPSSPRSSSANDLEAAALDDEAIRARVRARLELVDEGDYFSVLGVARDATSYEVRRAFVELRRAFEPTRILSPRLVDLSEDVRKIVVVLEEAYEILRDGARRERYRRAIDARPG